MDTLLRGGTLVTLDAQRRVLVGDLRISGNTITEVGTRLPSDATRTAC